MKIILGTLLLIFSLSVFTTLADDQISSEKNDSFQKLVDKFIHLTSDRILKIKEGSRPFILSQNKKAPTVVVIHGLSDSPGSMKEVANIYFKLGYNVVTVLLRDHGLLESYRNDARSLITLEDWREDIDQLMEIAFQMSDSNQVALIGFSLGGALSVDTADRYDGRISSLVLMAPLFKMNHAWISPMTTYLKYVLYSVSKGVAERPDFYPDITLSQIFQAYKLETYLEKYVTKNPKENLRELPKLMFLTDADTTIDNDFALLTAMQLNIPENDIVTYENHDENTTVLHRDLAMRIINASKKENPHIDELLEKLENFLRSIK